jgi:hypothetical protein
MGANCSRPTTSSYHRIDPIGDGPSSTDTVLPFHALAETVVHRKAPR